MSLSTRLPTAWALITVGSVIALGAGVVGYLWLSRLPDLRPATYGEQSEFTATTSGSATIFTSTGQSTTPVCTTTAQDGGEVVLSEPERYWQSEGVESTYGFTIISGTTYTVTCGTSGQTGRFAVAEGAPFPQIAFIAVGSLGLLLCAGGCALALWQRRSEPGPLVDLGPVPARCALRDS